MRKNLSLLPAIYVQKGKSSLIKKIKTLNIIMLNKIYSL